MRSHFPVSVAVAWSAAILLAGGCSHPSQGGPAFPGVTVAASGIWSVTFPSPAWTFSGRVGGGASAIATNAGSDAVGAYHEATFGFDDGAPKRGAIRLYDDRKTVIFRETYLADTRNDGTAFPTFTQYPQGLHRLAYIDQQFSPYSFSKTAADSPWISFDDQANTYILSAASHFMNAGLTRSDSDGAIACGISSDVQTLPKGFSQETILVAEPGINRSFDTWGAALLAKSGKQRPANDETVDLNTLGYWTDNGAAYYYAFDNSKGYTGTLLAVRDDFKKMGIPLGYMQLDSWWYPKGSGDTWQDRSGGEYTLTADPTLFSGGLGAFQQSLGLPLVTHARWIDPASPYRTMFTMSNNVSTDPRFWSDVGSYLHGNGVITYEQDWLDISALPSTDNLTDQDAFLDDMSSTMNEQGMSVQYCMPLPRHFLQSTRYPNLRTTRVSFDRFERARWLNFFFASRLASALGEWPWTDVFLSSERDNLLLSTLSGGMVGVGDALGSAVPANLALAVRPDGVIVKPDLPIVPLDQSILHLAQGGEQPLVAATFSDHGHGSRAAYVFVYAAGTSTSATFSPSELGYDGSVYVYDAGSGAGQLVGAAASFTAATTNGYGYFVVSPVGASGIAFLGDVGKFVALGKKRVAHWSDDGTLAVTLLFADGESTVTLHGYAPSSPRAVASAGSVGPVVYDAATQQFTVAVTAAGGTASLTLAR